MRGAETNVGNKDKHETKTTEEVREVWDKLAEDWLIQVGAAGDRNRQLASDPVLWECLGQVQGKRVLDAGCGTGYLTKQLVQRGAQAEGVDLSPEMIRIAQRENPELEFRVDSISELATCTDASFDFITSNYVLMDTPDLESAVAAFYRVLKPGGVAVAVFSHPCFPAGRAVQGKGGAISYHWPRSYFERSVQVDPPWKHFRSEFLWHHRPLSDYFAAFRDAGFLIDRFAEPHLTPERAHEAADEKELRNFSTRPYSVVFRLVKPS